MQKRIFAVLIVALFTLILMGCSQEAVEVPFADVCNPANDDQKISTVGYFQARASVFCSDSGGDYRCGMDFVESPGSEDGFTADVLEGTGRNQMPAVPDSYTDADIKFTADDGTVIGVGQRARITGEMLIAESVCLMSVDKIEAAE